MLKKISLFVGALCMLCVASAQQKSTPDLSEQLVNTMHQYYMDVRALDRVYIVDASPEKRQRYQRLASDYLAQLSAMSFKSLSQEGKADYVLFKRDLDREVYQAKEDEKSFQQLAKWFPFADTIYSLEKIRRRGGMLDGQRVAADFASIIRQLKPLQAQLNADTKFNVSDARNAANIMMGLQKALQNTYTFYNGYDPLFTWWVPVTYDSLKTQMEAYAATFRKVAEKNAPKKDTSGIVGYPIGREELIRQLNYELINYTPEELIADSQQGICMVR